jgi:adenylate kinase family enzyme
MNQKLTLVLIAGLSGSGKSTLANALSKDKDLLWDVVDKDRYREKFLRQGFDEEYARYYAHEVAFAIVRSVLTKRRASVILDCACIYGSILENIQNIVNHVEDAQLKVILCVADRDLRNERLRNRSEQVSNKCIDRDPATISERLLHYERLYNEGLLDRPPQFTKISDDPTTILDYLQLFKHLPSDYDKLELYTNKPLKECLAEAKDFLQKQLVKI